MSSCDHSLPDEHKRKTPPFNFVLKGAGAFAMIAITFVGAISPLIGLDYSFPAQGVAATVGAIVGVALSLRA